MKPLLVGYAPVQRTPGICGGPAFVGSPSGVLLAQLCGLDSPAELPEHFDLTNVYDWPVLRWDIEAARSHGSVRLHSWARRRYETIVLLGAGPALAVGLAPRPLFQWSERQLFVSPVKRPIRLSTMPRPSSQNGWYDVPANCAAAAAFLRGLREETMR